MPTEPAPTLEQVAPTPPTSRAHERRLELLPLAFLVLIGLGVLASLELPPGASGPAVVLNLATAAAILVGTRLHRPPRPWLWWLLAAAQVLHGAAHALAAHQGSPAPGSFLSAPEGLLLASFVLQLVVLGVMVAAQGTLSQRGTLVDGLILTVGLGSLWFEFLLKPYFTAAAPFTHRLQTALHPTADLALLLLGVLLALSPSAGGPAKRLFVGWAISQLLTDAAYALAGQQGMPDPQSPLFIGWLLSFALMAAAALHPSMPALTRPSAPAERHHAGGRLLVLACVALVPVVTELAQDLLTSGPSDKTVLVASTVVVFVLVMLRLNDLMVDINVHRRVLAELRQAQQELSRKNAELDRASQLKSEFLANMSHELRTPLSAILGYSEMLLEGMDGKLNPQQRQDTLEIQRSGQALLALINDILDLSKIEAGRMTLEIRPIHLRPVVESVVSALRPLAERKSLYLRVAMPADARVQADEVRTRQVLTNLVGNAIKFTGQGGVSITAKLEGDLWRVKVSDTGIGLTEEAKQIIFEEFRQADASTSRRFGGTGLGLTIARRLVQMQGGEIGVDSVPEVGSTFWFTLPAAEPSSFGEPAQQKPASRPLPVPGPTRNLVLVVDDEEPVRYLIRRRLEEDGFEVAEAADGEQALALAIELHPAVVTLDIMMEGTDGFAVLRSLKTDSRTNDIPVVMVSVSDSREMALAMGADAYVSKPFNRDDLQRIIGDLLPSLEGAYVLCVDDDPGALSLLERTLSEAGVEVRCTSSGRQALAEMQKRMPDALIVDLMMPEMSGFELVLALRNHDGAGHVPVLVLTEAEVNAEELATLNGHIQRLISKAQCRGPDLCASLRQTIRWSRCRRSGTNRTGTLHQDAAISG